MFHSITISEFFNASSQMRLLDVRTPAEFSHGHIPGAMNLPLFSNEERVQVGTAYKQKGREPAILLGFDLTGSKWSGFIKAALMMAPDKKVAVHCWRGGMRSGAMAWALDLYGFDVFVIAGGYKNYRRWAYQQFQRSYNISLIGGMTGSGKTKILHELSRVGEQIIDLEDIAKHQGSVYGSMNKLVQPTQEQFENNLALALSKTNPQNTLWVEDESINIGRCQVPKTFWTQMTKAPLVDIQLPAELRVTALAEEYGSLDKEFLIASTTKIRKRLGPEQYKIAVSAILENRMEDFIRQVLVYYDKTYRTGLRSRSPGLVTELPLESLDHRLNARNILTTVSSIKQSEILVSQT